MFVKGDYQPQTKCDSAFCTVSAVDRIQKARGFPGKRIMEVRVWLCEPRIPSLMVICTCVSYWLVLLSFCRASGRQSLANHLPWSLPRPLRWHQRLAEVLSIWERTECLICRRSSRYGRAGAGVRMRPVVTGTAEQPLGGATFCIWVELHWGVVSDMQSAVCVWTASELWAFLSHMTRGRACLCTWRWGSQTNCCTAPPWPWP